MKWKKAVSGLLAFAMVFSSIVSPTPVSAAESRESNALSVSSIQLTKPKEGELPKSAVTAMGDNCYYPEVKDISAVPAVLENVGDSGSQIEIARPEENGIFGFNAQLKAKNSGTNSKFDANGDIPLMISFKLYLKKLPSSDEIALVSKGDRQFAIVLKSNGLEYYTTLTGASGSWKNNLFQNCFSKGFDRWYEIILISDGGYGSRLYVDDVAGPALAERNLAHFDTDFTIGCQLNGSGNATRKFTNDYGYLADVKFYNGAAMEDGEEKTKFTSAIKIRALDAMEDDGTSVLHNILETVTPTAFFTVNPYDEKTVWGTAPKDAANPGAQGVEGLYDPYDPLGESDAFRCGTEYKAMTVYTAHDGYTFSNDSVSSDNIASEYRYEEITNESLTGYADCNENGKPSTNATDGNLNTYWHSQWASGDGQTKVQTPGNTNVELKNNNFYIVLDANKRIGQMDYWPRQERIDGYGGQDNGDILKFKLYYSTDQVTTATGGNWTEIENGKTFTFTSESDRRKQTVYFDAPNAKTIRVEVIQTKQTESIGIAEVALYEKIELEKPSVSSGATDAGKTMVVTSTFPEIACNETVKTIRTVSRMNMEVGDTEKFAPSNIIMSDGKSIKEHPGFDAETDIDYEYASSNSGIATVDANGTITAKAVGKTTITVTALIPKQPDFRMLKSIPLVVFEKGAMLMHPEINYVTPKAGKYPEIADVYMNKSSDVLSPFTGIVMDATGGSELVLADGAPDAVVEKIEGRAGFNGRYRATQTDQQFDVKGTNAFVISLKLYLKRLLDSNTHEEHVILSKGNQYNFTVKRSGDTTILQLGLHNNVSWTKEISNADINRWLDVVLVYDGKSHGGFFVDGKFTGSSTTVTIPNDSTYSDKFFAVCDKPGESDSKEFTADDGWIAALKFYNIDNLIADGHLNQTMKEEIDLSAGKLGNNNGAAILKSMLDTVQPTAYITASPFSAETVWKVTGEEDALDGKTAFTQDAILNIGYTVTTTLTARENFVFGEAEVEDIKNKQNIVITPEIADDLLEIDAQLLEEGNKLVITISFLPRKIPVPLIEYTSPVAGNTPRHKPEISNEKELVETYGVQIEDSVWSVVGGETLAYTDVFEEITDTNKYQVQTELRTDGNYLFDGSEEFIAEVTEAVKPQRWGNVAAVKDIRVSEDGTVLTVTLKYETPIFYITFDLDGGDGTGINPQSISKDNKAVCPEVEPTRPGYKFLYWYDESDTKKEEFDFDNTLIRKAIVLKAAWGKIHTVTFHSNRADINIPVQKIEDGGKAEKPDDSILTASNMDFEGWYENADFTGTKFSFDTQAITTDLNLYARWTATVTYDVDGNQSNYSAPVTVGGKVTPIADPTKTGYVFKGWYRNAAHTGEAFDFERDTVPHHMTLYAKFVQQFTVTFNSNGGSSVQAVQVESGERITRPEDPTKTEGETTFVGWYSDQQLTQAFDFSEPITGNMTLYAKWTDQRAYDVVFLLDDKTEFKRYKVVENGFAYRPEPDPVKQYYIFDGWYIDNDATFRKYDFATPVTENLTLTARFIEKECRVTFHMAGGTPAISDKTQNAGTAVSEPTGFEKAGYTFIGWYDNEECAGEPYDFSTLLEDNLTLYAKWKMNAPEIAYTAPSNGAKPAQPAVEDGAYETIHTVWSKNGAEMGADESFTEVTSNSYKAVTTIAAKNDTPFEADEVFMKSLKDSISTGVSSERAAVTTECSSDKMQITVTVVYLVDVSSNKPVSASSEKQGNEAANAVDDDKNNEWQPDQAMTGGDAAAGVLPWLVIDLEAEKTVFDSIEIAYRAQAWATKYSVQTSDSLEVGASWNTVVEVSKESAATQTDPTTHMIPTADDNTIDVRTKELKRFVRFYFKELNSEATGYDRVAVRDIKILGTQSGIVKNIPATSITVTPKSVTLTKGINEKVKLTTVVKPDDATNKNIIWTTSDKTVATVINGEVTAVGVGKATITATSAGNHEVQAAAEVTVKEPVAVTESLPVKRDLFIKSWRDDVNKSFEGRNVLAVRNQKYDVEGYGSVGEGMLTKTAGDDSAISFLQFDLSDLQEPMDKLTNAKLRLYVAGVASEAVNIQDSIKAAVVPAESGVTNLTQTNTWEKVKTAVTAWSDTEKLFTASGESLELTTPAQGNTLEPYDTPAEYNLPNPPIVVEIDITEAVQNALEAETPGTLMLAVNETKGKEIHFVSSEGSAAFKNATAEMAPTIVLEGEKEAQPDAEYTVRFLMNIKPAVDEGVYNTATVISGQKVTRPATDPEREGYTFAGWYAEEDCATEFDFNTAITEDTDIYAKWTINQYTVTYVPGEGGSLPDGADASITVDYGTVLTDLPTPTNTDNTKLFMGWYLDISQNIMYTNQPIESNTTLTARWADAESVCEITFNTLGGSEVESVTVIKNEVTAAGYKPENPTKEGYTFGGWYKEEGCTTEFVFGTDSVTGDTTLYAGWLVNIKTSDAPKVSYTEPKAGEAAKPAEVAELQGSVDSPAVFEAVEESRKIVYAAKEGVSGFNASIKSADERFNMAEGNKLVMTFKLWLNSEAQFNSSKKYSILSRGVQYMLELNNGKLVFCMETKESGWPSCEYTMPADFTGKWHDIVLVIDGSGTKDGIGMFVDENFVSNGTQKESVFTTSAAPFAIGADLRVDSENGTDDPFPADGGYISDFRFYNLSTAAEEIAEDFVLTEYAGNTGGTDIKELLKDVTPTASLMPNPYDVTSTTWSEEDDTELGEDAEFEENKTYVATTVLTAAEGFAFPNTAEFINAVKEKIATGSENTEITKDVVVSEDGRTLTVTVTYPHETEEPSGLTINRTDFNLPKGAAVQLTVTGADTAVTWASSAQDIATVEDGLVTGLKAGTATITATAGAKKGKVTVTVAEPVNTSLNKPVEESGHQEGDEFICGNVVDGDSATRWVGSAITDGNPATLTIDLGKAETIFTEIRIAYDAKAYAQDYIIETSNSATGPWKKIADIGKSASAQENTIDVLSALDTLTITGGTGITITKKIVSSNLLKQYVKFSFKKKNENATFAKSVSIKEIEIMGAQNEVSGTPDVPATGITLDSGNFSLEVGETKQLNATVTPADSTDDVMFTSDEESVATVSDSGLVTAVAAGTAVITATAGSATKSVTVTVSAPTVTGITVSPTTATLDSVGATKQLTANVTPAGINAAVSWTSSKESVATVNDTGLVTAVAKGTATITATAGGKSATATITVNISGGSTDVAVTGITVTPTTVKLTEVNATKQLNATVTPSNATNKTIEWSSSDESVATVSDTGLVTAVAAGDAVITASAAGGTDITATVNVTVEISGGSEVPVTGITVSPKRVTLREEGETKKLTATVKPEDAEGYTIKWTSDKKSVATVDDEGTVTAVGNGTAKITAAVEGTEIKATATITVNISGGGSENLVTSITLNKEEFELTSEGQTEKLEAAVLPEDASNTDVIWKSSDESVAVVDEDGVVTAVGNGTATITAEAADGSGITATATVTVKIAAAATNVRVTFNANGGTGAPAYKDVIKGTAVAKPANPKRTGYTFKGWFTKSVGGTAYNFAAPVTANITLYAQWLKDCTVKFNANGGAPAPKAQTIAYGGFVKMPAAMTRSGYKFVGWYTDPTFKSAFNFKTKVTANLTLYAKWDAAAAAGASQTYEGVEYSIEDPVKKTAVIKKADSKKAKKVKIKKTVVIKGVTCTVVGIGKNAFKNCKKMTTLTIGPNVTKIEKGAFQNCKKLKNITIQGKALKTIKSGAFKGTPKGIRVKAKGFSKKQKKTLLRKLKKAGMKSPKLK